MNVMVLIVKHLIHMRVCLHFIQLYDDYTSIYIITVDIFLNFSPGIHYIVVKKITLSTKKVLF